MTGIEYFPELVAQLAKAVTTEEEAMSEVRFRQQMLAKAVAGLFPVGSRVCLAHGCDGWTWWEGQVATVPGTKDSPVRDALGSVYVRVSTPTRMDGRYLTVPHTQLVLKQDTVTMEVPAPVADNREEDRCAEGGIDNPTFIEVTDRLFKQVEANHDW